MLVTCMLWVRDVSHVYSAGLGMLVTCILWVRDVSHVYSVG